MCMSRVVAGEWSRWYRNRARWRRIDSVRLRPAMYIGDTGKRGVCQLVDELLDVPLELFAEGRCTSVRVRLFPSGACSIEDDGLSVSDEMDERTGLPLLEAAFTHVTHVSHPTFRSGQRYRVTGGLHGIGPAAVSALSAWLEVESHHEGRILFQRFERGVPVAPAQFRGPTNQSGLKITFLPDPTIFKPPITIPEEWLSQRLRELAFLNKGFSTALERVTGEAQQDSHYCSTRGVLEGLEGKVGVDEPLLVTPVIVEGSASALEGRPPVGVEIALTWTRRSGDSIETYVNNIATKEGGTHVDALRAAINESFHAFATQRRRRRLKTRSFCEGLVAFASFKVPEPAFEGCTRSRLGNPEVAPIVRELVSNAMKAFVTERPSEADSVIAQAVLRRRPLCRHRVRSWAAFGDGDSAGDASLVPVRDSEIAAALSGSPAGVFTKNKPRAAVRMAVPFPA